MDTQEIIEKLKQYPIATGGFILVIVLGIVYFLRKDVVSTLSEERDALQSEIAAMERNARFAVDLDQDLEKISELGDSLDSRIMDQSQRANNYRYFYSIETDSGAKMEDLRQMELTFDTAKWPDERPKTPDFMPIEYNIRANGSFQNLVTFLNQIEYGKYLVRFDQVLLNLANTSTNELSAVELTLRMDVLGIQNDPSKIKAAKGKAAKGDGATKVMDTKERTETLTKVSQLLVPDTTLLQAQIDELDFDPFIVDMPPPAEPVAAETVVAASPAEPVQPAEPVAPKAVRLSDDIALEVANKQLQPSGGLIVAQRKVILTRFGSISVGQVIPLKIREMTYNVSLVDVSIENYTLKINSTTKTFSYSQDSNRTRVQ